MDYPNPIHWDEEFARSSKFGGIVAPQSFTVGMDYGHGCHPACVGNIPGSHLIFGGEEWWFYGHARSPGDKLFQERRFHGYKVTDTKFAGPDHVLARRHRPLEPARRRWSPRNARPRSAILRPRPSAAACTMRQAGGEMPRWTRDELLARSTKYGIDWIMSNRDGVSPRFDEVQVGDQLAAPGDRPALASRALPREYRAFMFNIWGTFHWVAPEGVEDPWINQDRGLGRRLRLRRRGRQDRSAQARRPLSSGPRAAISSRKAPTRSAWRAPMAMARRWARGSRTTCLLGWPRRLSWHSKAQFRGPAFEGDVTYFDGEVVAKEENRRGACRWSR